MAEGLGLLSLIGILFLVVLAICWIVLRSALIGTKPLLRELVAEMKRNNQLLDQRLPALRPTNPANVPRPLPSQMMFRDS
jgi:uncharacterized membrane protein YciS (DUF1049 family)